MLVHEILQVENTSIVVYKISIGYSVGVRDNDAEENIGFMYIYKTESDAIAKAESLRA